MKKALLFGITLLTFPTSLLAGEKWGPVELTANVAMVSDYVWRGISQSDRHPAVQGGFDLSHEMGFYLGLWGSNVDFDDGNEASLEADLYGGWTRKWDSGLGVDLGLIRYNYPGANHRLEYDFYEYYMGLSHSLMGVNLAAKYSYSPDFFGVNNSRSASYLDIKADYTFPPGITLAGHYGYSFGNAFEIAGGPDGYADYCLSVGGEVLGFGLEAGLYGTDQDGKSYVSPNANWADDRFVVKVSKKF